MTSRKLNVLVYTGTGSTVESVKHAIYSLRRLLSPNYAVIPITETVLLKEPWGPSCALLVFPGGADLGYCRVLNGEGNLIISEYVRRGGSYLGFCAGGYYGCKKCEFEVGNKAMEVVGSRELAFFPGTCRGGAFKGFQYHSENGARAVRVNVVKDAFRGAGLVPEVFTSYYNGGGVFVNAVDPNHDVEVLASYASELDVDGGRDKAALVYCKVGQGAAILTGPHPEFAAANLSPHHGVEGYDELIAALRADDDSRTSFLKACLTKLGLEGMIDYSTIIKHIVTHDAAWPEAKATPYFNHNAFYSSLREYRLSEPSAEEWGDFFMYGEVVTSTNTLLEKNFKLLSRLPSGFTLAATTQVAGRGRGSNVWVSPAGSLIMSTVINHPAHLAPSRPIVFIQYLAAIAIVQAVKSYDRGYSEVPVKLKWPNDIYALDPRQPSSSPPSYVKIGGILSNCSYSSGSYQIVLGIGINATNGRPTTSLDALLPSHLAPFRIEKLIAGILTHLEALYKTFVRRGFTRDMEGEYYKHWLHGRQIVNLEAQGGVKARIVGITSDWGMLRAEELGSDNKPTGKMWALQSDENSFDFFRGLIKRKI